MTPDEFRDAMAEIIRRNGTDWEVVHSELDVLCWQVLRDLGYDEGVNLIDDVTLWYA